MADINPTAQSLLNGLNGDAKLRGMMDFGSTDELSSGQFLEVMSASLSASDGDNSLKANSSHSVDANQNVKYAYKAAEAVASKQADSPVAATRAELKQQIKTKLKEIAAKNDTPVKDTKAMKALQKVASFLIKANDDGKISLPAAMVQKLKDFVAKGDDLNAADMTQFMSDFNDMFKQLIIPMPAQGSVPVVADSVSDSDDDAIKWPAEITDALKDLGLTGPAVSSDKPLTIVDVLRTVKALVNQSEKAAVKALDEKSKEAELPQDQASILLVGNAVNSVKADAPKTDTTIKADNSVDIQAATATQAAAPIAASDDASVKKAIKDLEKGMEQAVQNNKDADPAKDDKAAKIPTADAGKIVADPIAKALNAAKPQAAIPSLDLSAQAAPAAKAPAKAEAPSLTKISMDAQAPNHNNDKSYNENQRDNNNAHSQSSDIAQAKVNLAASIAAPSVSDIKVATDLPADQMNVAAISPAGLNAVTDSAKASAKITMAAANTASSLPSAATQQVIAQIQAKGDKATQISVNLTPAELGQVEVRLNIQKDGSVHTVVTVDKPETLLLLQKDSAQLERSLQQAGLDANAKNMSFNLRDGNQAQQFNQGRKRFSRADIGSTVTEVAVTVAPEGQVFTDTRVNYHA